MWMLRITEKGQDIIDRVAAGNELSYDDIHLAKLFWSLSSSPYIASRFYRDYTRGDPTARRLESLGYIEKYEDKSFELLENSFKSEERRKYKPEEILPTDIAISQKGKKLMDNLVEGYELSDKEVAIGKDLWFYCREENSVPPWNIKKLLSLGYLTTCSEDEEDIDLVSEFDEE